MKTVKIFLLISLSFFFFLVYRKNLGGIRRGAPEELGRDAAVVEERLRKEKKRKAKVEAKKAKAELTVACVEVGGLLRRFYLQFLRRFHF